MGKIIGVISLKGGVGKTSVVSCLGDSIGGSFGKKVLIVDGNLSAPNLGLHHNVVEPAVTLHHVLERSSKPSDAIYELDNMDILPGSLLGKIKSSPLRLKDRISYLKKKYDIILLDSSPALDDETLAVMLASDEILVVTTPDHPTLSNTIRAVKLAKQRGTPIIGLVLNKVYNKKFELSIEEIENITGIPVMAVIPHDVQFLKALSEFMPYTSYKPRSDGSEEYRKLAALILGEKYNPKLKNFFGWLSPKIQDINRQLYYDGVFR